MENSGKISNKGIKKLLRSFFLYSFQQPISRENRLSIQQKIQLFVLRYSVPAIWFMLNLNNIINPVKLQLAVYCTSKPDTAKAFLKSLSILYKCLQLAISDPISLAIFFYWEIILFFKYYIKVEEELVFQYIINYFNTIKINK